ncbi:MAG TPA: hypothetical protein VMT18_03525 [Planctomycetota bacterium]|nr:hypothetical protein [Planctomycetota bacterium]
MTHLSPRTLLALALVVTGAAPQEPQTGLRPEPRRRDPEAIQRTLEERLQGAWQLIGVTYQDVEQVNSGIAGYMLVLPEYLSIEMHVQMRSKFRDDLDRSFFQSGVHRWRIFQTTKLETSSLIGNSNVNDYESWVFEAPGTKRTFQMVLKEGSLVLERAGESRMTFKKLPRLPFPGRTLEFEHEQRAEKSDGKDTDADETGKGKDGG